MYLHSTIMMFRTIRINTDLIQRIKLYLDTSIEFKGSIYRVLLSLNFKGTNIWLQRAGFILSTGNVPYLL